MKYFIRSWFVVLLLLNPASNAAVAQEVVVIVHPDHDVSSLDRTAIEQIYMGKATGTKAYDLPASSPVRERFYTQALGKSMQHVNSTRARLAFSGRGQAPEELINSKAVKSVVASNPNTIGYIDKSDVDETVKVVTLADDTGGKSPY